MIASNSTGRIGAGDDFLVSPYNYVFYKTLPMQIR